MGFKTQKTTFQISRKDWASYDSISQAGYLNEETYIALSLNDIKVILDGLFEIRNIVPESNKIRHQICELLSKEMEQERKEINKKIERYKHENKRQSKKL